MIFQIQIRKNHTWFSFCHTFKLSPRLWYQLSWLPIAWITAIQFFLHDSQRKQYRGNRTVFNTNLCTWCTCTYGTTYLSLYDIVQCIQSNPIQSTFVKRHQSSCLFRGASQKHRGKPLLLTISVLGSFTCITQHTGPTALRPIRRTKQLWLSVLLKDTSAATGNRTHILVFWQHQNLRPISLELLSHENTCACTCTCTHQNIRLSRFSPDYQPYSRLACQKCNVLLAGSLFVLPTNEMHDTWYMYMYVYAVTRTRPNFPYTKYGGLERLSWNQAKHSTAEFQ